jgi:hypothetical protein
MKPGRCRRRRRSPSIGWTVIPRRMPRNPAGGPSQDSAQNFLVAGRLELQRGRLPLRLDRGAGIECGSKRACTTRAPSAGMTASAGRCCHSSRVRSDGDTEWRAWQTVERRSFTAAGKCGKRVFARHTAASVCCVTAAEIFQAPSSRGILPAAGRNLARCGTAAQLHPPRGRGTVRNSAPAEGRRILPATGANLRAAGRALATPSFSPGCGRRANRWRAPGSR